MDRTVQCAANPSISASIFVKTLKKCTPNSIYFKKAETFRVIYYFIFIKKARKSNFVSKLVEIRSMLPEIYRHIALNVLECYKRWYIVEHRDRAGGWKHAKLSGHSNEALVKTLLDTDKVYLQSLLERMGYGNEIVVETSIGGLHETNVPSVIGNKTKSKTDLKIKCQSGREINVSIKKSLGGQVYFVRAGLFIEVFEKQFGKKIPNDVVRAIELFWAAAEDAPEIIEQYADKNDKKSYTLQVRHKSLNATTLKNYDSDLYNALLNWFKDNAYELAKISFTMGAARDKSEWSEFVWYINILGENDVDEIFHIDDICNAVCDVADTETFYGSSNGGTTIQLPFGFVQWHQAQLQFHHNFDKVSSLLKEEL